MPFFLIPFAVGAAGAFWKASKRVGKIIQELWHRWKNHRRKHEDDEDISDEIRPFIDEPPGRHPDPPPSAPTQPALLFRVFVTSEPSGAQISVDGDYASDTPYNVPLAPGKHKISLKLEGRKPWKNAVKVIGEGQRIHVRLK